MGCESVRNECVTGNPVPGIGIKALLIEGGGVSTHATAGLRYEKDTAA
jgi:hypothetical protein